MSSLRDELMVAIASWGVEVDGGLKETTSLIASGRLDSLALFHLVNWIEDKVGSPVDATAVDLRNEWDTVVDVVKFVELHRRLDPGKK